MASPNASRPKSARTYTTEPKRLIIGVYRSGRGVTNDLATAKRKAVQQ